MTGGVELFFLEIHGKGASYDLLVYQPKNVHEKAWPFLGEYKWINNFWRDLPRILSTGLPAKWNVLYSTRSVEEREIIYFSTNFDSLRNVKTF